MLRHIVLVTVILSLSLAGCRGGPPDSHVATPDCAHRIGYVTGSGPLNDGADNQVGWEGVLAGVEALGLNDDCASFIEALDSADYSPNIASFASEGFDIVVTSGLTMGEATREAGHLYPDVFFVSLDQRQIGQESQMNVLPNVAGLVSHEEREGFLAGVLAGLLTETGIVGGVFGCETLPPVIRYAVGFRNGVQHVNPDAEVLTAYHIGSLDVCFSDPDYGAQLAGELVEGGADIIYGAGGQTGVGALIGACQANVRVIGSGVDRYVSVPYIRECVVTSVTRNTSESVRDLILGVGNGTFAGGDVYVEPELAPYHDFENVIPQAVKDQLEDIGKQMVRGEIDACAPPNEGAMCSPNQ